jgi:hypothetical protein
LFEVSVVFRDLSKEVLMWSGGRGWDMHVIQDANYYRDGSVEVTVPVSEFWMVRELERFVCAGVFVWYMVISGLQVFGIRSRVSGVEVGAGLSCRDVVRANVRYGMEESKKEMFDVEVKLFAKLDNRYMVGVPFRNAALLGFVANWLAANEGAVILRFVANRLAANEDAAVLSPVVNWLAVNEDVVILS